MQTIGPLRNFGGAPAGASPSATGLGAYDFVEHCHNLGLGVAETQPTPTLSPAAFRAHAESLQMRIIMDVSYPRDEAAARFRRQREARQRLIKAPSPLRAASHQPPLRRDGLSRCLQERFRTLPEIKHRPRRTHPPQVPHETGHREPQRLAFRGTGGVAQARGQRVGGRPLRLRQQRLALRRSPGHGIRNLLPYVVACHIKDMALDTYEDGFLLSEVPLGEGFLDLKGMVAALRQKDPNMAFDLEMITRDPLKIPIFTDKYWVTFDDTYSPLPARDLAHTLDLVRKNKPKTPLPRTAGLSNAAQLKLEDENISRSIAYIRQHLELP